MAATIEIAPLPDSIPISMEAIRFRHMESLANVGRKLHSPRTDTFCAALAASKFFLMKKRRGKSRKMAIGAEPHVVQKHTIDSTDEPIIFKVPDEV